MFDTICALICCALNWKEQSKSRNDENGELMSIPVVYEGNLAVAALKQMENLDLDFPAWSAQDYKTCYEHSTLPTKESVLEKATILNIAVWNFENLPAWAPEMIGLLWNPKVVDGQILASEIITSSGIRTQVAWWFPVPEKVFVELAQDPYWKIREYLAKRKDIPFDAQKILTLDSQPEVCRAVARNTVFSDEHRTVAGLRIGA